MPTKAAPVGENHSLCATGWNLDLGSDRVGAVADINCLGLGYLGRVRVVDIPLARFRHLRARGGQYFDSRAVIQWKSLVFTRLEEPQIDQLLELVRILRGEIMALGPIFLRMVQLPGILRVVTPAGDRRVRRDRLPALVPDTARP